MHITASYSMIKKKVNIEGNAQNLDITSLKANKTLLADKICPVTTELKINAFLLAFKFVMPWSSC